EMTAPVFQSHTVIPLPGMKVRPVILQVCGDDFAQPARRNIEFAQTARHEAPILEMPVVVEQTQEMEPRKEIELEGVEQHLRDTDPVTANGRLIDVVGDRLV